MNKNSIFDQNIEVQKIYKDLNFNMNKKEDDLKNLINEKDLIIQEMDQKLKEQEKIIYKNKNKIKTLNEKLNQVVEQLKEFKALEVEIKNLLKYNKSNISLNSELNSNNFGNNSDYSPCDENTNNESGYEVNSDENEDLFYDEYEDLFEEDKIIVNNKNLIKKGKKKKKIKKEQKIEKINKDNLLIEKFEKNQIEEHYMLIGKTIPVFNQEILKNKNLYSFKSNILRTNEHFYLLKHSINLPNMKMNKIDFDLSGKFNKFPLDITPMQDNEDLLYNKFLLLVVETLDNNIICLFFNKSELPKNCFYLFINEKKLFYYQKKNEENIYKNEKNVFFKDEICHARYKYNKETVENIGELKSFFFDGFFRLINNFESLKCKEIEVFEILSE